MDLKYLYFSITSQFVQKYLHLFILLSTTDITLSWSADKSIYNFLDVCIEIIILQHKFLLVNYEVHTSIKVLLMSQYKFNWRRGPLASEVFLSAVVSCAISYLNQKTMSPKVSAILKQS